MRFQHFQGANGLELGVRVHPELHIRSRNPAAGKPVPTAPHVEQITGSAQRQMQTQSPAWIRGFSTRPQFPHLSRDE